MICLLSAAQSAAWCSECPTANGTNAAACALRLAVMDMWKPFRLATNAHADKFTGLKSRTPRTLCERLREARRSAKVTWLLAHFAGR
jgi:hypothetical protein